MTKRNTESVDFAFTVKETPGDPGWMIMLEPRSEHLSSIAPGFLTLDLRPGTTEQEARGLAKQLGSLVEMVSHTQFRG